MWVTVHAANVANGTLRLIPDAWKTSPPHEHDGNSDHPIRCFPDEAKAEVVEIAADGVVFFCYGTPHATGDNQTEAARLTEVWHREVASANSASQS